MLRNMVTAIGVLIALIGGVFIAGILVPDPIGKMLADPFCEGELTSQGFGFLMYCEVGNKQTSVTDTLVGVGVGGLTVGILLVVLDATMRLITGLMMQGQKAKRVLDTGESAQARILEMTQTGAYVNYQPMVKFRLEVMPPHGASYEGEFSGVVPMISLAKFSVGMIVPVKYDPQKPEDVVIDAAAIRASQAAGIPTQGASEDGSLKDKLQQLEESYRAGLLSQSEYEAARKRILESL